MEYKEIAFQKDKEILELREENKALRENILLILLTPFLLLLAWLWAIVLL